MPLTFTVPSTELTATLHNRRSEVIDNIFTGTPLLNALRMYNGVMEIDGGLEIVENLRFEKNTTAGSFADYDTLDTGLTVH